MTITNGYCTLADFKARHNITSTDTNRDAFIEQMVEAASRLIDNITGRVFYATTATKYFTASNDECLRVKDLLSVTTLKTDEDGDRVYETTWSATDFDLMPFNDPPYQWIEVTPNGQHVFTRLAKGVEIAGSWGFVATTPDAINEACLLLTHRLYKRNDTVFGVLGASQLGQIRMEIPKDDDALALLAYYKRGTL